MIPWSKCNYNELISVSSDQLAGPQAEKPRRGTGWPQQLKVDDLRKFLFCLGSNMVNRALWVVNRRRNRLCSTKGASIASRSCAAGGPQGGGSRELLAGLKQVPQTP